MNCVLTPYTKENVCKSRASRQTWNDKLVIHTQTQKAVELNVVLGLVVVDAACGDMDLEASANNECI